MGENTKIEWARHTFNPWVGCTKIKGPRGAPSACDFCYAESWAKRTGHPELWEGERRRTAPANWCQPAKWDKAAAAAGEKHTVFGPSLADPWDNQVDPSWRRDWFRDVIDKTPNLIWLLLTKRPQNIIKMAEEAGGLPTNVALGTTVEDQEQANQRIPHLLRAKGELKALFAFLSCEPLLGPVDLHPTWLPCPACKGRGYYLPNFAANYFVACERCIELARKAGVTVLPGQQATPGPRLDQVIAGGESGGQARPSNPAWFRKLRDDCAAASVAFFFKQWGEFVSVSEVEGRGAHFTFSDGRTVRRVGKKRAGRTLDGVEHNGMPQVRA